MVGEGGRRGGGAEGGGECIIWAGLHSNWFPACPTRPACRVDRVTSGRSGTSELFCGRIGFTL